MPGVVDTPAGPAWPGLGYSIGHQKVELEIDFANKSLRGKTEITIHPHIKDLKVIGLNFRQGEVKRVTINGKTPSFKHADPYDTLQLYGSHYHGRLASKIQDLMKTPPRPDLLVTLPKNVRIDELDPLSIEAQNQMALRATATSEDPEGQLNLKAPETSLPRFTELTASIEFTIDNVRDGLQFVGVGNGDRRYPHAYTTNPLGYGVGCPFISLS